MATITVTNTNDSGAGSLRAALAQAASTGASDTIVFAEGLRGQTITLQSRLDLSDSSGVTVTGDIDGDGDIDVTISGDSDGSGRYNATLSGGTDDPRRIDSGDSAFLINRSGSKATFRNIEFDGGYYAGASAGDPDAGGVIVNSGDLTIDNSVIDGVRSRGDQTTVGGTGQDMAVIVNRSGGTVKLTDLIIDEAYVRASVAKRQYGATGGDAALIINSGDMNVRRIAFDGYFYGGSGVIDTDANGTPLTNGGDAHSGVLNFGIVAGGAVVGQRSGSVTIAPGAAGQIVQTGPNPTGATGSNLTAAGAFVVSKDGGTFSGKSDFPAAYANDAATSVSFSASTEAIGFLGIGGNDTIVGSAFGDFINGGRGDDIMSTGEGDDIGGGNYGDDTIRGEGGRDQVIGDGGDDMLFGGDDRDTVDGSDGDDMVRGDGGADRLIGGRGDDTMIGGSGGDTLTGGAGGDRGVGGGGNDRVLGNGGRDTVVGGGGDDRLVGGGGNDRLFGGGDNDSLFGGGGNDRLIGGGDRDRLVGGGGNDRIVGGGGNDNGSGGGGRDRMIGGGGRDKLAGNASADTLIGGGGNDRLIGGGQNDRMFGGKGGDVLIGGGGGDRLDGGAQNDRLIGGGGNDVLFGRGGSDRFIFGANQGTNHIRDFQDGVDRIVVNGAGSFEQLFGGGDDKGGGFSGSSFTFRGTTVVLDNFDGQLDEGDFIF